MRFKRNFRKQAEKPQVLFLGQLSSIQNPQRIHADSICEYSQLPYLHKQVQPLCSSLGFLC